ncbi:MAG: hypothetical protein HC883_05980 [Bdellovibrionaceae bacterium]|nr:hypothetical protein [Pseudobdellovibrionaceae bacterium]
MKNNKNLVIAGLLTSNLCFGFYVIANEMNWLKKSATAPVLAAVATEGVACTSEDTVPSPEPKMEAPAVKKLPVAKEKPVRTAARASGPASGPVKGTVYAPGIKGAEDMKGCYQTFLARRPLIDKGAVVIHWKSTKRALSIIFSWPKLKFPITLL